MLHLKSSLKYKVGTATVILVIYLVFQVESREFSLKKRVRRTVLFTKSSKFFFRINGKDNVLNYTTLLAHGWGFRINFDLPSTLAQRHRFFKRDVHQDVENIKDPKYLKYKVGIAIVLLVVDFLSFVESTEFSLKKRVKRKVLFTKSSKFFFRINGKDNMLNHTTFFSHGWGFRINYELPSTVSQRRRFFKRDLHKDVEDIKDPILQNLYGQKSRFMANSVDKEENLFGARMHKIHLNIHLSVKIFRYEPWTVWESK
ncbi:unnamed protein product [Ceutorhynchus assimilis]|uniref:Uncharacterized protein n=1 Tax=Ceutorhynchus assimilis TaxID=467358 RepID=A0A9N9QJ22_9CUCU|nr:unnamed protein product [Ceutorhynchus assimilis]